MATWRADVAEEVLPAVVASRVRPSVLLTILTVILALNALWWIAADSQRALNYPYSFDFGEGILLNQAVRLSEGRPLYPPINPGALSRDDGGLFVDNYTPLYPWLLSRPVRSQALPHPAPGRALSFLGSLGIVVAIWFLGKRYAPRESLWPVALGLAWLATAPAQRWGLVVRVDTLGIALTLAGLLGCTCKTRLGRAIGPWLLGAAVLTKQSFVSGPLALTIAALMGRENVPPKDDEARKRAVNQATLFTVIGAIVGSTVGSSYANGWRDGSGIALHTLFFTANEFSWPRLFAGLGEFFALSLPLWGLYGLGLWRSGQEAWADPLRRPWLIYPLLATGTLITFGATGSDSNYYLEPIAALLAACAVLWSSADAEGAQEATPSGLPLPLPAVGVLLLTAFVLVGRWGQVEEFGLLRDYRGSRAGGDQLVRALVEAEGPVLCEDLLYTLRAGHTPDFQPYIFRLLAERDKWDEQEFVDQLTAGRYGLIALQTNLYEPGNREESGVDTMGAGFDRFSPAMEHVIKERYHLVSPQPIIANGAWYLYAPN